MECFVKSEMLKGENNKLKFSFCENFDKPDYKREILWKLSVLSFQKLFFCQMWLSNFGTFGFAAAKKM